MTATRGQYLIGKMLGSFVLEKLLGCGGSSAVFLAQQQDAEQKVAVKVFLPRANMDVQMRKDFYNRFLREAHAASQLDHPNILPIYAYGEQDSLPYIVMPYMSGGTLSEYIAKHDALPLQDVQWYLEQIAYALDYVHEHGCVHCDVKPANILIDDEGHAMLSDFGIARVTREDGSIITVSAKNPEALMGTPDYISPEQAMGYALDGRSDVYSLGVTVFHLLAKHLPFHADTSIALALCHVHKPPPSLAMIRMDISSELDSVVQKALAKSPAQRFQSAGDFGKAFAQTLVADANGGSHSQQISRASKPAVALVAPRPAGRSISIWNRRFGVLGMAGLLAVIMLAVFSASYLSARFPANTGHNQIVTRTVTSEPVSDANVTFANLLTDDEHWATSSSFFYDRQKQRYHILNKLPQNVPLISLYGGGQGYTDFRLTVTMEELHSPASGSDFYGVIFRSDQMQSRYYCFAILTSEQEGRYMFWRYDNRWDNKWEDLTGGVVSALLTDSGKSNTVTIEVRGNSFTFAINGEPVGKTISDTLESPLMSGRIGLFVEERNMEVAFSHLSVYAL